jgi:hypothetical protein
VGILRPIWHQLAGQALDRLPPPVNELTQHCIHNLGGKDQARKR